MPYQSMLLSVERQLIDIVGDKGLWLIERCRTIINAWIVGVVGLRATVVGLIRERLAPGIGDPEGQAMLLCDVGLEPAASCSCCRTREFWRRTRNIQIRYDSGDICRWICRSCIERGLIDLPFSQQMSSDGADIGDLDDITWRYLLLHAQVEVLVEGVIMVGSPVETMRFGPRETLEVPASG